MQSVENCIEGALKIFEKDGDVYAVTTDPTKFNAVLDAITAAGFETIEAEIKQLPKAYTEVDVEIGKRIVRLMDTLDGNDDVQNVWHNWDAPEEEDEE